MGAWLQGVLTSTTTLLPYTLRTFRAVVITLEPDRWLLQVQPAGYMRFDHGVEQVTGTHLLTDGDHFILPPRHAHPILDESVHLDLSKCFVEVDVVEMSMSGKELRHTLSVVPFPPEKYGQTCEYHLTHVDFRPLAAPTQHLNQLRVHLRNSECT